MSPETTPLLRIEGVAKCFGAFHALDGLNFNLQAGEILGLVGPNGSGKTTCINVISGLYAPEQGQVRFEGRDVTGLPSNGLGARGHQPHLSDPQALSLVDRAGKRCDCDCLRAVNPHGRVDFGCIARLARPWRGLAERPAADLNTVQQKMLDLARALATGPRLLLIDELAAGLNPAELKKAARKLKEFARSGMGLLVVEHLMGLIDQITDRVVVMNAGKEIFEGVLGEAAKDPKVVEVFLGAEDAG